MAFDRGDLLLIPVPFTDLSASKRRPVLAMTRIDSFGDFVALPVTSRPRAAGGMPLCASHLVRGTLPKDSWIRVRRPVTLSSALVVRNFGSVSADLLEAAVHALCAQLSAQED